jgi:hypothetical protein
MMSGDLPSVFSITPAGAQVVNKSDYVSRQTINYVVPLLDICFRWVTIQHSWKIEHDSIAAQSISFV